MLRLEQLVALAATLALTGCTPAWLADPPPLPTNAPTAAEAVVPALRLAITPTVNTRNLPVSTEVGIRLTGGVVRSVVVATTTTAKPVSGKLREDGTSWVPARPLAFATTYTATITATSVDGSITTVRATQFTTMAAPSRRTGTGLYLFSGQTYGVAMPVVVEFSPPVPRAARAGVQRRLFVTSDPPQVGAWHWASASQAWFRPARYWQPGTALTVRIGLAGHPTGNGYYGDTDRSATVRIGTRTALIVDNQTKQMLVYAGDKLLRKIPVSLGKPSTPSSSGQLVIMSKEYATVFDTTREGPGGYRVSVNYAMRLTWGGEFIHAAPWSVGDQGRRNVSHGCVNISYQNAAWLFGVAKVGDPVTVRGTEVQIVNGNGWTAWNLPWEQYVQGSALPVPAAVVEAGRMAAASAAAGN